MNYMFCLWPTWRIFTYRNKSCYRHIFSPQLTRTSGVTLRTSFMIICIGIVPVLISTIAMLPRSRIPWPLPANYGENKGAEAIDSHSKTWNRRISGRFLLSVGWTRISCCLFCFVFYYFSLLSYFYYVYVIFRHQARKVQRKCSVVCEFTDQKKCWKCLPCCMYKAHFIFCGLAQFNNGVL